MIIEFGQVKLRLLILLIYPIGIFFARYLTIDFISNPLYYLFLFFISHFLALTPIVIYKIKNALSKTEKKSEDVDDQETSKYELKSSLKSDDPDLKNQIEILKGQIEHNKRKDKILLFLLIALLYFLSYLFFYYFNYITNTKFYGNISMVTEVLYFSLFNWAIFGNKMYSHHLFSMILITIGILALYILLIIQYIDKNDDYDAWNDFIFPTLLNFIVYCIFCYCLIKTKYFMEKYFIISYYLIVYLGIFCIGLLIIIEPITFFIPCNYEMVICDEKNKRFAGIITALSNIDNYSIFIFYSLGLIVTLFMTCLGLWLTVKNLSPCHFLTSDSIITFELNILFDIVYREKKLIRNVFFYIFSIIIIFGCLIYNEIIVINICKLNFNTRKQIIKRQSKDIKNLNYELPDYTNIDNPDYLNHSNYTENSCNISDSFTESFPNSSDITGSSKVNQSCSNYTDTN